MIKKAIYRREYATVVIYFNEFTGESESLDVVGDVYEWELDALVEANGKPLEGWTLETK